MMWQPGQKLQQGKYAIAKILGQGGFGITYLVKDKQGNPLVIKTLNDYLQRQYDATKYQQDFINEALRLAKFRHPHIVRVDEVIKEDEQWCIVMEYIEGETLAHRVWHHGVLSESEALGYIQQVGEALTLIHNQGLLHRDIKPLNIMRRPVETVPGIAGYEAVLIDFGIAREFSPNITQTHTQSLSEGFAPIEQYDWRSKRGAYTDVYALAATLYALLTGEIPLPAPMRAYRLELESPQQLNPKISDRVNQAILKGMALQPEARPQSVAEWLVMLGSSTVTSGLSPDDYQRLRTLLAAQHWQAADQETAKLMLKVSRRDGWLRVADIETFPAQELHRIDKMWREYSRDRFGLTVQKQIWQSILDKQKSHWQAWCSFGDRVGWRVKGNWVSYNRLQFSPDAPVGELPALIVADRFALRQQESVISLLSRQDL